MVWRAVVDPGANRGYTAVVSLKPRSTIRRVAAPARTHTSFVQRSSALVNAMDELSHAHQHLASLLRHAPVVLFVLDETGIVRVCNDPPLQHVVPPNTALIGRAVGVRHRARTNGRQH